MVRLLVSATFLVAMIFVQAGIVHADDRLVRLAMPTELAGSGLPKYMLPRFSLKTQVRVQVVSVGDPAEAEFGTTGQPIFVGLGQTWHLHIHNSTHPGTKRFADWLVSEVGQRAIVGLVKDGVQVFDLPKVQEIAVAELTFEGDAALGRQRSLQMCGRCHVVDPTKRMNSIDSTPSFFALRSLPDWEGRFQAFYTLNPHPAFTQVKDVTPPFPATRPSPIVPVEMTLEDVEAILAFVATLTPADLGAELEHQ